MPTVVLVTGASSGLGRALALLLHKKGYSVYGSSRNASHYDMPFPMLSLDVTDSTSIRKAVGQIIEREGRIDVLINNAGVGMGAPVEKAAIEDIQQLFDTNVYGVLRTCQAVLPHMRARRSGKIINISSIGSTVGLPFRGGYCASKAAVDMFSETLRLEVKAYGIEVCSIQAGDMQTPIKSNWIGSYHPDADEVYGDRIRAVTEAAAAEVDQGILPESVARQIELLLQKEHLKKSYAMGKPLQRISLFAKRLLPAAWFERIIMKYSKLES